MWASTTMGRSLAQGAGRWVEVRCSSSCEPRSWGAARRSGEGRRIEAREVRGVRRRGAWWLLSSRGEVDGDHHDRTIARLCLTLILTCIVYGEYQKVWGGVHALAMATSIRNGIHRLHDQKTTHSHPPAQIGTPHFSVLPSLHSCHSAPRARRHGPKRGTSFHGADQGDRDHLRVRPPSRRHRIGAAAELAVATQEPLIAPLDAALGERGILFVMDPGNAHARRCRRWMDRSITCGVAPCSRDGASARRGDGRRPWRAPCVRTARRYRQGRRASHTRSASLRARCGTD